MNALAYMFICLHECMSLYVDVSLRMLSFTCLYVYMNASVYMFICLHVYTYTLSPDALLAIAIATPIYMSSVYMPCKHTLHTLRYTYPT